MNEEFDSLDATGCGMCRVYSVPAFIKRVVALFITNEGAERYREWDEIGFTREGPQCRLITRRQAQRLPPIVP